MHVASALIEQLTRDLYDAEEDLVRYREMLQVALRQNHELTQLVKALRQQVADRRDEIRRYTESQIVSS